MKLIIFDMDGVTIDSQPIHSKVDREILEEYSGGFDGNLYERFIGTTDKFMWTAFKEEFNIKVSIEYLLEQKLERFIQYLEEIPLMPGVKNLMAMFKKEGYYVALASSNNKKTVEAIINKFNLKKYLDFWITGDEVKNGKPDPEIFFDTAKHFKVKPSECLVIEDSENGVKAAKVAGMICVGYRNFNSGNHDLSNADLVIGNYNELNLDVLKALFLQK